MKLCIANCPVKILFRVYCTTEFGEALYLVGSIKELSNWNIKNAIELHTKNYSKVSPLWESNILLLPTKIPIEYKFFKKTVEGSLIWEQLPTGINHIITISFEQSAKIYHLFGDTQVQVELKDYSNKDFSPRARKFTNVMFLWNNRKIQ